MTTSPKRIEHTKTVGDKWLKKRAWEMNKISEVVWKSLVSPVAAKINDLGIWIPFCLPLQSKHSMSPVLLFFHLHLLPFASHSENFVDWPRKLSSEQVSKTQQFCQSSLAIWIRRNKLELLQLEIDNWETWSKQIHIQKIRSPVRFTCLIQTTVSSNWI